MPGLKRARRDVLHDSRTVGAIRWHPCHLRKNPHVSCRVYVSRRGKKTLVVHVRTLEQTDLVGEGMPTTKVQMSRMNALTVKYLLSAQLQRQGMIPVEVQRGQRNVL